MTRSKATINHVVGVHKTAFAHGVILGHPARLTFSCQRIPRTRVCIHKNIRVNLWALTCKVFLIEKYLILPSRELIKC